MNNNQQTVVITGANRGIGLGLTEYYLRLGWRVVATHRPHANLAGLESLIKEETGELILAELDVANEHSIQQFGQKLAQTKLSIYLLINNAGVSVDAKYGQWSQAIFANNFNVNLIGPALVIQALESLFSSSAKVIQISTGLASLQENIGPDEPFDAYAVSKIALNLLTKRLANKSQNKGLIFAAISPGWVSTDMGGSEAPTSVAAVSEQISQTISRLTTKQSGSFIDASGINIPW